MISLTTNKRPGNPNVFGDYSQKELGYLQAYKNDPLNEYNIARYNEVMFARNPEFARPKPSRGMTGSRPMLGMLGSMSQPSGQQFTIKNPFIKRDFLGRTQEQRMMADLRERYREEQAIKQRDAERKIFMDDNRRKKQEEAKLAAGERERQNSLLAKSKREAAQRAQAKREEDLRRRRTSSLPRILGEDKNFTEQQQYNLDTFARARPSGSIFGKTKSMSVPGFGGSMATPGFGSSNY